MSDSRYIDATALIQNPGLYDSDDAEDRLRELYDGIRIHTTPTGGITGTTVRCAVDLDWDSVYHGSDVVVGSGPGLLTVHTGSIDAVLASAPGILGDDDE